MDIQRSKRPGGKASYYMVIPIDDLNLVDELKSVQREALKQDCVKRKNNCTVTSQFHITLLGFNVNKKQIETINDALKDFSFDFQGWFGKEGLEIRGVKACMSIGNTETLFAVPKAGKAIHELACALWNHLWIKRTDLAFLFEETSTAWVDDPRDGSLYMPHITLLSQPLSLRGRQDTRKHNDNGVRSYLFQKLQRRYTRYDFPLQRKIKIEMQNGHETIFLV